MEYKSMIIWNPWHGCKKYSSGCLNCYVYRRDQSIGKDSSIISKTNSFDLPLKRNRSGEYKITASDNPVYICMTSDFFIEYADQWRKEIWNIIRIRTNLSSLIQAQDTEANDNRDQQQEQCQSCSKAAEIVSFLFIHHLLNQNWKQINSWATLLKEKQKMAANSVKQIVQRMAAQRNSP